MVALVSDAELPPKIAVHPRPEGSFGHAMPAHLRGADPAGADDLVGIKWIAGFPENRSRGLPTLHGSSCWSTRSTAGRSRSSTRGRSPRSTVSGVAIDRFRPARRLAPAARR